MTANSGQNQYIISFVTTNPLYKHTSQDLVLYDRTTLARKSVISSDTDHKCASRWRAASGKERVCLDGIGGTEENFDGTMTRGGLLRIGLSLNGNIKNVIIWDNSRPDEFLEAITK